MRGCTAKATPRQANLIVELIRRRCRGETSEKGKKESQVFTSVADNPRLVCGWVRGGIHLQRSRVLREVYDTWQHRQVIEVQEATTASSIAIALRTVAFNRSASTLPCCSIFSTTPRMSASASTSLARGR